MRTKNFKIFEAQNDKRAWIGSVEKKKGEKGRKKPSKSEEHVIDKDLFVLFFRNLIGQVPIGYQLSQAEAIPQKF